MTNRSKSAAIEVPKAWISSAGLALGILAFINLFNYLDRYLVSALVESLVTGAGLIEAGLILRELFLRGGMLGHKVL